MPFMQFTLHTLSLVWLLMGTAFAQYSEQVREWPQVRLQLSQDVIVTDLFRAGLQPYLRPNAENRNIYAKHAHITVLDRDGRAYPSIPTDILRTTIQKPWLIETMEIWTPPLTIKEARSEMLKWLPVTRRSEKELDDFLRAVEADWLHYDIVNGDTDVVRFADGWTDADGVKKTLLLMKSWQWQAPLRLCFDLGTTNMQSRKKWVYHDGPIPPPPGFERANMKAPEDWEADHRFIPVTTEPRPAQGTLPPKYQAMNDKAQAKAAALRTSLTIIAVIMATIGLLWLWLKRLRKIKSTLP
jgi:hypothetical protein